MRDAITASIAEKLSAAWGLCASGQFDAAEEMLNAVMDQSPSNDAALMMFARLQLQRGDTAKALRAASLAVGVSPANTDSRYTLGRIHMARGEIAAAELSYRRALAQSPDRPDILISLGILVRKAGRPDEAVALYRRALDLHPAHPEATKNLNNVLAAAGAGGEGWVRAAEGRTIFSDKLVDALRKSAERYAFQGKFHDALNAIKVALQFNQMDPNIWFEASTFAMNLGFMWVSLMLVEGVIRLDPKCTPAVKRARGLCAAGGLDERARRYAAMAYSLDGSDEGRIIAEILLPAIQQSTASIRESRVRYEASLDAALVWKWGPEEDFDILQLPNFYLAYQGENDRDLQVKAARLFSHVLPRLEFTAPHCVSGTRREGRIRVGIISKYLASHSIGKTTRGLIDKLDRTVFEVFALRITPTVDDEVTKLIRAGADHTVTLDRSVTAAREQIAALELDILFYQDLGMEPTSWRLAFARLAPVQCVSFGHPNTSGIPSIDYFVSNDLFEMPNAQSHYSEELFMLHDLPTLAYYYKPELPTPLPEKTCFGFPADATLYLCPQTLFKLHPDFDEMLGGILERDPAGLAVLICGEFDEWQAEIERRFARTIPAVANRLVFLQKLQAPDFLRLLAIGDAVLDPVHFNGMNSSLEAFAVGTPVVTLPTKLQRGRHTQAMYRKMGLSECIAKDANEYVEIAVRLGTDPAFAQAMRQRILSSNHVLFEDLRVVAEFERFFLAALAKAGVVRYPSAAKTP